jgi:ribonuclease HI
MDYTRMEPPPTISKQTEHIQTDNPTSTPTTHKSNRINNNKHDSNPLDRLCPTETNTSENESMANNPTSGNGGSGNPSIPSEENWEEEIRRILDQCRLENEKRLTQLETWKKQIEVTKQNAQRIEQHGNNNDINRTTLQQPANSLDEPEAQETEKVVQWNINGFYQRLDDIKLLIEELDPTVLCLQETRLTKKDKAKLAGYRSFLRSLDTRRRGVAIFVKRDTTAQRIDLITDIEAVAVRIGFDRPITVCSIYIAPNEPPTEAQIGDLADQLPIPYIITGDVNAHNNIWDPGAQNNNRMGTILENFVNDKGLVILNTGEMTHYSMAYNSLSAIDLTVCTADLATELGWYVVGDLHNSDHYPTVTSVATTKTSTTLRRRWRMDTAKWPKYRVETSNKIQGRNLNIEEFTEIIQQAATNNIKKTSGKPASRRIKWMTEELRELIRQRRRAERKLRNHKTDDNVRDYQRLKATTRLLLKKARQEEWRQFVNTMTVHTPSREIWGKIGAISGKRKSNKIPRLRIADRVVARPLQIANCLAQHFAKVSKTTNYSPIFQTRKKRAEEEAIYVNMEDESDHNSPFSKTEMHEALKTCKGSSPGPDDISYEMVKQLGDDEKESLLATYNAIWQTGEFPEGWRKALTIPIPKPGKDPENLDSYRPISLTSCLGKIMEKMVNKRLVHILEKRGLIPEQQYGFRSGRSTTDVLNILQSEISHTFLKKKYLALASLDLSKAYDTCWRHGIISWLKDRQIDGRILQFISGFLSNRSMKTMVGALESDEVEIENGVPQGAVLSVTLFLIAIADICRYDDEKYKMIGYADDWYIYTIQEDITSAERILQNALDRVNRWTQRTGFNISIEKTKAIVFTRLGRARPPLKLELEGHTIEEVPILRILGLTFDMKLLWKTHIKDVKARAKKRINILRCLAGTEWGADRDVLLRAHHAIVLSALRYGETAYGSACKSLLDQLESIHNTGTAIAIGAFCTTRSTEIHAEAGSGSLSEIRDKTVAITGIRTREKHNHPLKHRPTSTLLRQVAAKSHTPAPFNVRVEKSLRKHGLYDLQVHENCNWKLAPWEQLEEEALDIDMLKFSKSNTAIVTQNFNEQIQKYIGFHHIYTDGSKTEQGVGYSIEFEDDMMMRRPPRQASVYSAEATAIYEAGRPNPSKTESKLILTDSLSTVMAVQNNDKNPIIQKIVRNLWNSGGRQRIKWIPGHSGIAGNEAADMDARLAISRGIADPYLTADDAVAHVKKMYADKYQKRQLPRNITRKEQVAVSRWRMGYTRATRRHIIEHPHDIEANAPICDTCHLPNNCVHLLLHCTKYTTERITTGLDESYKDGTEVTAHRLLLYLRATGLLLET